MNKKILITGAAGFLGSKYCSYLIKKKYSLIAIDIDEAGLAKLKRYGDKNILTVKIDITNKIELKELEEILLKKKIFISSIINNAAIDSVPGKSKQFKSIKKELEVSLEGSDNIIKMFLPKKKIGKKLKKIINIGSDLSVIAPDQRVYKKVYKNFIKPSSYSIIKHGIVGLTKYYASLLAKDGVAVNMISPGPIFNNHKKQFVKNIINLIPFGRMGMPKDIFPVLDLLLDDRSEYITGQNILIDGGRSII